MRTGALLSMVALPIWLAAQTHDPGFNGSGYLNIDVDNYDTGHGVVATGAAIYLASVSNTLDGETRLLVSARNSDGSPQNAFGTNGQLMIEAPGMGWIYPMLKALPDGSLILAAMHTTDDTHDVAVMHLSANGVLDNSFGVGGSVLIDRGPIDALQDLLVLPAGHIALLTHSPGTTSAITLLMPNGAPMSGYGTGGTAALPLGVYAQSLTEAPAQGLWVSGMGWNGSQNDCWIGLLGPTGTFNNTFSGDGQVYIDLDTHENEFTSDIITTLAPHPQGGLLALVNIFGDMIGYGQYRLAHVTDQGMLVPTFATNGIADVLDPGFVNRRPSLLVEPDGRSVIATGTSTALELEKRTANGELDNAWGTSGTASLSASGRSEYFMWQAIHDPQGHIVTVGAASVNAEYDIAVDRVLNDLQPVAIDETTASFGVRFAPNLAQAQLSVLANEPIIQLDLLDGRGSLVYSARPNAPTATIPLGACVPGLYLVRASSENTTYTGTIVKP